MARTPLAVTGPFSSVPANLTVRPNPAVNNCDGGFTDGFGTDSIGTGKYTFLTGTGTVSVVGGLLVPSTTVSKRFYRNDVLPPSEVVATGKWTSGAALSGATTQFFAVGVRIVDNSNFIEARVRQDNTFTINVTLAGTGRQLGSASFTLATATSYWVRVTTQGNLIIADLFTVDPQFGGASVASVSGTLSAAEAVVLGVGQTGVGAGIAWTPNGTDERADDFRFTNGNSFPNDGRTVLLYANNVNASQRMFVRTAPRVDTGITAGLSTSDMILQPADTTRRFVGPFPPEIYNQPDGNVYVDVESGAASWGVYPLKLR